MDCCDPVCGITNLKQSEDFLTKYCDIESVDSFLDYFLEKWTHKWSDFSDISVDVYEKVKLAHAELLKKCLEKNLSDFLHTSIECIILNKLHDYIVPLVCYLRRELDKDFYDKCKELSDLYITAEQLGAPSDYAIPLAAAVVEFASMDTRKTPVEKVYCLCTTYDLIFAELKTAIIEIISKSSEMENQIPVIENKDIIPILMAVIIKAKVIHLYTSMYYIENFLWKLQESDHVQNTISIFNSAIEKISTLTKDDLKPSNEKVCRELDLRTVSTLMIEVENNHHSEQTSLVENHVHRLCNLILTSTSKDT